MELKASRKGSRSSVLGLRAASQGRRSWLGGESGARSSCTPTWLSQGLFSHLDPAHCPPMLGSVCSGFGPGSCTQKLASDLRTVTLPARVLVSTITRPTAWSLNPPLIPSVTVTGLWGPLSLPPPPVPPLLPPDCPSLPSTIPSSPGTCPVHCSLREQCSDHDLSCSFSP